MLRSFSGFTKMEKGKHKELSEEDIHFVHYDFWLYALCFVLQFIRIYNQFQQKFSDICSSKLDH